MPRTGRSIEVEAEIAKLIKSGDWPVGYRIGTQQEIAEQFRCSRSDVNRAFVSLRDRGMLGIERDPGGRSNCVEVIGVGEGAEKNSD
jgi:DNA-binding GntR family transcriptional regulator